MNRVMLGSGLVAMSFAAMGCDDRAPTRATASVAPTACASAPVASTIPSTVTAISTPSATPIAASTASAIPLPTPVAAAPRPLAQHLTVKRLVVARGVKDHEPLDPETSIRATDAGRVYAFVEVTNQDHAPGEVFVSFEPPPGHRPLADVRLSVGDSPRWRTWAFTREARDVGEWTAVVRDARGQELARTKFDVTL